MSHLSAERLAALIDEQPTPAELAHLSACAPCRRERGAYEAVSEMAKSGLTLGIPLTSWNTLAPRLKDDRIIETGRSVGRRVIVSRGWLQAAAAILLLAGGTVFGRLTAGVPVCSLATSSPAAIKTRLATLDRVSQIVGAALEDAPYDSVINTMYLNAQGQREASMRQLSSASGRLTSY